jgi:nitroreductase
LEVFEAIYGRRSIRRYKSDPIPEEALMKVLDAGRWAPSWANSQCWEFIVVKEEETKRRLSETLTPRNPAMDATANAPVVLAVCARLGLAGLKAGKPVTDKGSWWYMFDTALAVENLCLAAHALGLGTVIVGAFNHEEAKRILGVPEGIEIVALIPLGYPAEPSKAPKRKEISEITYANQYGKPYTT